MIRRVHVLGSTVALETDDPNLFSHLGQWLPSLEDVCGSPVPRALYRVLASAAGSGFVVMRDRRVLAETSSLPDAARELAADIVVTLSRTSAAWTFIHAGVVAVDDGAILLPGASHSGKTTLVRALLRAGAEYGSDEFAVIDDAGRVHPWPRWLGIRTPGQADERVDPARLGARIMTTDVPVRAIVFTTFQPDAVAELRPLTPGEAALRLLPHCLAARARTAHTLRALRGLTLSAQSFESPRAEADEFAALLLPAQGASVAR